MIEWNIVLDIIKPIFLLLIGALIARYFERKPKLLTHYGHIATFRVRHDTEFDVFTHSIVVRNAGNTTARNITIGHNHLPENYQIYPSVNHEIRRVPDTGNEIYIPALVPKEQITISYLYYPPTTYKDINTYVKSESGYARHIKVILQPQPPKLLVGIIWTLIGIGSVAIIYISYMGINAIIK